MKQLSDKILHVNNSGKPLDDESIGMLNKMATQLKELDPEKIKHYGKLSDNEDDLSKLDFINKKKSRVIFEKFKTRRCGLEQ